MKAFVFDIETAPLPEEEIEKFAPKFEPFCPSSVKVGNLKDQGKIIAKIKAAEMAHNLEQQEKRAEWMRKATLDAKTSKVLAIGSHDGTAYCASYRDYERSIIGDFWQDMNVALNKGFRIYGWNIVGFDLPFLIQRSLILGVRIPFQIETPLWRNHWVRDLQDLWTGGRGYCKLDHCAEALGLGGKVDTGGKLPHEFWDDEIETFLEYLERDVMLTRDVAARFLECGIGN